MKPVVLQQGIKMNLKYSLFCLLSFLSGILPAQYSFNHQPFDSPLQTYVNEQGLVEYKAIKEQPDLLGKYLDLLEKVDPLKFEN